MIKNMTLYIIFFIKMSIVESQLEFNIVDDIFIEICKYLDFNELEIKHF